MNITLTSNAEKNAENAESLKVFSGIKLLHIKKEITKILSLIGQNNIFDQYTKHDISHINSMLQSLDWLIPEDTQKQMTPTDWMLIVLAIYFHDLGMLVTKDEFANRHETSFTQFRKSIIDGEYGLDYKEKIFKLKTEEEQDRFIYQELVRKQHGERIKFWLLNEENPTIRIDLQIVKEIKNLISKIDSLFLNDLALICESHQKSDLDNFEKYKISQPYGSSPLEEANVFYAALILRTADLLHITSDRTPSIEFNLINPSDPISVEEWAKQQAVKNIRPQTKKNKDGNKDDSLAKDTLEITALFETEKGYFALISYLSYVKKELIENYKLNDLAKKKYASKYDYPWQNIDDTNIQAKDFEKKQFEFILDQNKILDLLVGHTLYNDSAVVLRELSQNSIDAVKLKKYELNLKNQCEKYNPSVNVLWDSENRHLYFKDNGTGMDLDIIQNHLLKVGSSRYQDEEFKKKYPNFSSISRFGIGLLTCFLIADDVDILTKTEESDRPVLLKIRKVHGKYLLKYSNDDPTLDLIDSHGTSIKLYVRNTVDLVDIDKQLKKWILFPECSFILHHEGTPIKIGYVDPKNMLEHILEENNIKVDNEKIKVVQQDQSGITFAYALRYNEFYKSWRFISLDSDLRDDIGLTGISIQGIRVDHRTPGFDNRKFIAVANSYGIKAPKTNVARSNIELTEERDVMLSLIYSFFLKEIMYSIEDLKPNFSITWSITEGNWNISEFITSKDYNRYEPKVDILEPSIFKKVLMTHLFILVEKNDVREATSIQDLNKIGHYWTTECESYTSANNLVKEIKASNISALSIIKTIYEQEKANCSHLDLLLCPVTLDYFSKNLLNELFQVNEIKLIPDQRRLDLNWGLKRDNTINWMEFDISNYTPNHHFRSLANNVYIQISEINLEGLIDEVAINSANGFFILKNNPVGKFVNNVLQNIHGKSSDDDNIIIQIIATIVELCSIEAEWEVDIEYFNKIIDRRFLKDENLKYYQHVWELIDRKLFIEALIDSRLKIYDNTKWYRRFGYF